MELLTGPRSGRTMGVNDLHRVLLSSEAGSLGVVQVTTPPNVGNASSLSLALFDGPSTV
jgi:hypothetical protein